MRLADPGGRGRWRSRTPASRPSTTARGASAAPGSSSGCPARSSRGGPRARWPAGSSLELEGAERARGRLPLADGGARGPWRVRADGPRRSRPPPRDAQRGHLRLRRRAHHAADRGVPRLPGESGIASRSSGSALQARRERDGEHPLFALERGQISEAEFRRRIEAELGDGVRPDGFREIYFEQLQPNRAMIDYMAGLRGGACAWRCSPTTCASGSRSGGPSCPSSTTSSSWWSTRPSSGCASPSREIYELTLERLGGGPDGLRLRRRPRAQLRDGPLAGHDRRALQRPGRQSPKSKVSSPTFCGAGRPDGGPPLKRAFILVLFASLCLPRPPRPSPRPRPLRSVRSPSAPTR